ncbi:peptidylprolyl isomerase [Roseitalea porphyridii]|uniref:Peptidylprolyl isomerase n=1 Tax=Roseitalea porphyridii TaxID=1852022 RepID=A0A4P6V0W0_9HYPH|nr:peptidylprolyl isomerase [Roseitalea porphyridii]QBK30294.1 peptidylprolyl isomerase [Roseitalea porphyridii]
MTNRRSRTLGIALATLAFAAAFTHLGNLSTTPAAASEIRVIVNDEIVTSYDIARRAAFLRLQQRGGNVTQAATDELIEEALKRDAVRRAGIRIPDSMVDDAFANFAQRNNMSPSQMMQILGQSGVTVDHFKEFIRLQIGWGQTVQLRARAGNQMMSEQEAVARMLEQGGQKPTSTEYILQQVIFVVPENQRGSLLSARRTEANRMRGLVSDCERTVSLAQGLRDVTVRDLGRVLELQLPSRWAEDISGLQTGQTTPVKETERGVEFIVVCRARQVSDDRVAQLEFSTEALESDGGDVGAEFLEELRANARIQRR